MKELIAQLQGAEPDGEMYDAKVKVLSEYVKHHVKEEQNEMFPKIVRQVAERQLTSSPPKR